MTAWYDVAIFLVSGDASAPLVKNYPQVRNEMPTPISPSGTEDRRTTSFRGTASQASHTPDPFTKSIQSISYGHHALQFRGNATTLRTIFMTPEERYDCALQIMRRCLAMKANRVTQRFSNVSTFLSYLLR